MQKPLETMKMNRMADTRRSKRTEPYKIGYDNSYG